MVLSSRTVFHLGWYAAVGGYSRDDLLTLLPFGFAPRRGAAESGIHAVVHAYLCSRLVALEKTYNSRLQHTMGPGKKTMYPTSTTTLLLLLSVVTAVCEASLQVRSFHQKV